MNSPAFLKLGNLSVRMSCTLRTGNPDSAGLEGKFISREKLGGAGPCTSAWLSRLAAGLWEDRDSHILANGTHTQGTGHSLQGEGLPSVP